MDLKKNKNNIPPIKSSYVILIGLLVLCAALIATPNLVARFLLTDHDITPGGINQLNSYRHLLSLPGLFLLVIGLFPLAYKIQAADTSVSPAGTSSHPGRRERIALATILLLTLAAGIWILLWLTPYGAGVTADSLIYFNGARSIAEGNGFFDGSTPITHFPPLLPLLLAAISFLEPDLANAARFLNALFMGLNAALFTWAVYLSTGRKFLPTVIAALFVLSSQSLLNIHTQALSEPLFIALTLAGLILLSRYANQHRLLPCLLSAIFLGLGMAARYIGISFLPPAVITIFLLQPVRAVKRKIRNTVLWAVLALLPLGLVMLRNSLVGESATNRTLTTHILPVPDYLEAFSAYLGGFFLANLPPSSWLITAILLTLVPTIILLFLIFIQRSKQPGGFNFGTALGLACFLFFVTYFLFLWFSISFMDASTDVNQRFVTPIALILSLGLFPAFWHFSHTGRQRLVWLGFLLFMVFSLWNRIPSLVNYAATIRQDGYGYAARVWKESETIAYVRSLPADMIIYSNGSDVIRYLAERKANSLPVIVDRLTEIGNTSYNMEMEYMCRRIQADEAVLVNFNLISWRNWLPTQEEIQIFCNLPVLQELADGVVFGELKVP